VVFIALAEPRDVFCSSQVFNVDDEQSCGGKTPVREGLFCNDKSRRLDGKADGTLPKSFESRNL
jgi:hypothetical protein